MKSFGAFLKNQDAYGQAITINYRGEDKYRSVCGAILTMAQRTFILVVAVIGLIDLFNFKDPKITQYRVFDKRNDDHELNLGENYGGFLIGIQDLDSHLYQPIDPKYGSLTLSQVQESIGVDDQISTKFATISVDEFTQENFPDEFDAQILDDYILDNFGTFYSSKEFHKLQLMNQKLTTKTKLISLAVEPCNPTEAHKAYECASPEEINQYFSNRLLAFYEVKNFINYKSVGGEPIQRMSQEAFATPIASNSD